MTELERGSLKGSPSRISRQQVLDAMRRHFEKQEAQNVLAGEMGISPSYLTKLFRVAQEEGWATVRVDSLLDGQTVDTEALRRAKGQLAFTVDGSQICVAIETAFISASRQSVRIGNVTVTIVVERS